MLTNKELTLAGWASVLSALVTLPQLVFSILLETTWERTTMLTILEEILMFIYLALFLFIYQKLKKLLNQHANFHDADLYISLIIWTNVAMILLSGISMIVTSIEGIVGVLMLITFFPLGIVIIVFGFKLLKCAESFSGRLKPFAYLNIATGVCLATVILFMFSFITGIVSDIFLAIIFFSEIDREKIEKDGYGVSG